MSDSDQVSSATGVPEYRAQPFGSPWFPEGPDSPHALDYKFSISDPDSQARVKELIAKERAVPGSQVLSLGWLKQRGRYVSFNPSQTKRGCFVQAGCVVTDGFGTGKINRVLTAYRSEHQFHDSTVRRHTSGFSGVFATVLASFKKQDPFGHVPTSLFNDIHDYCPWALFSRKLLLPDIHMDSRFVGLGYNFRDEKCGYIFLIWHVRTRTCPEVMQVPACQSSHHDVPFWQDCREVRAVDLANKPIDQFALARVLGWSLPDLSMDENRGLLEFPKFADVWKQNPPIPAVVERDEVILDLLRMYQQEFHGSRRAIDAEQLRTEKEKGLQRDLAGYLEESCRRHRIHARIQAEVPLGWMPQAGRADIVVEVYDYFGGDDRHQSRLRSRYLIECKLSDKAENESEYINQCKEYRASSARVCDGDRVLHGFDAIVILHGVTGPQSRFALQGAITYPDRSQPIHVVRVAVSPAAPSKAPPTREVVHAIIPLADAKGNVHRLLFTQTKDDPSPRLPGGRVEAGENHIQALFRELDEELDLKRVDIDEVIQISPGSDRKEAGFTSLELSRSSGEMRLYLLHPFLVVLTLDARRRIAAQLGRGDHEPRAALISEWSEIGLGHNTDYAKAILPHLNPEMMRMAAIDLGD